MEHQAYVQVDGDVGSVSAECKVEFPAARQRSEEFALVARPAVPYGCGNTPRYRSPDERTTCGEDRWAKRKALPTRQSLGRSELSVCRYSPLRSGKRQWTLPPYQG